MASSFLQKLQNGMSSLQTDIKKYKNKKFMQAAVASCAMVAIADGVIEPSEKRKMFAFMRQNEALAIFDVEDISSSFDKYIGMLEADFEIGKGECLRIIHQIKSDSGAARLLIRVCGAVAASDGHTDKTEEAVIREICLELGLNAADFGL